MQNVPNTMGQLRKMLAEACHEVRYGHMEPARGIATAKIAAQIGNLIQTEIDACRFMAENGLVTNGLGELPINKMKVVGIVKPTT